MSCSNTNPAAIPAGWSKASPTITAGFISSHRNTAPSCAMRARYTEGYQTAAGFLEFVVTNYDHELVLKMNAAMRQGRYSPELWKEFTGKSLQELDRVCGVGCFRRGN